MTAPPSSATLPAHAETCLRRLWVRVFDRQRSAPTREELRAVAREVSAAARQTRMLPEHLVVAVKQSWSTQAELREAEQRHAVAWALTELISLCIWEFYHDATAHAPGDASAATGRVGIAPEQRVAQRDVSSR